MPHLLRRLPFTFHLGLLPVVLVLWAWADSIKRETLWNSGQIHDPSWWARSSDSGITCGHTNSTPSADPLRPLVGDQIYWRSAPPLLEGPFGKFFRFANGSSKASWFPPFRSMTEARESIFEPNDLVIRTWVIPYWLILVLYLPLWFGLVLAHARHHRGKLAASIDPS